jgi:hypothetical protein
MCVCVCVCVYVCVRVCVFSAYECRFRFMTTTVVLGSYVERDTPVRIVMESDTQSSVACEYVADSPIHPDMMALEMSEVPWGA